ncbi:RHS repeat-associated core domain-containing protein [uncultured Lacinutrix sp.]|uniref:RHS repeat-associated core domain-containing protein n=1 Tax=uncultured Lacinutrix sp. TaxID=574032 RepID=UPI00260B8706|nr:RHS repeat-associated core domain-containing protein [uncultured Lacinutrix sp.]
MIKQTIKLFIATCCCFFLSLKISAQTEVANASLTPSEMIIGATSEIMSPNATLPNSIVENPTINISLEILDDVVITPSIWFTYETKIRIDLINVTSGQIDDTLYRNFKIEYSPFGDIGNYVDLDLKQIKGHQKVAIRIDEILVTNKENGNSLGVTNPGNVILKLEYTANRYKALSNTLPVLNHEYIKFNGVNEVVTNAQEAEQLNISWLPIDGAIKYQLEWSWIDSFSGSGSTILLQPQNVPLKPKTFERNSARVTIKNNAFKIPLVYANGFLVYRVRAIGNRYNDYNNDNDFSKVSKYFYGQWTDGYNETTVSQWNYAVTSQHQGNKNWQFQASFAEEGKKKEVVSYFDGTLRNRQTVTKINTDGYSIVGEVIYDNQGRPAIEVLPTPDINSALDYKKDFNLNTQNKTYSHYDFDWSDPNALVCETGVTLSGMSKTKGASLYYSGENTPFVTTEKDKYIPDANNYPFSQIQYTDDNTGRIKRKSGVGLTHQIGSGHEMKYYYGTPNQNELNRLFGYKVGYNKFYKKNTVIDPNKQVSVSYLDPQGRTIATALSGNKPANIDPLEEHNTGNHNPITVDLLNKSNLDDPDTNNDNNLKFSTGHFGSFQDGLQYSGNRFVNKSDAVFSFNYKAELDILEKECGTIESTESLVYPFVYDLNINLTNECGDPVAISELETTTQLPLIDGQPATTDNQLTSFTTQLGTITNTAGSIQTLEFTTNSGALSIGNYTINKTITINEEALNTYVESYMNSACILPLDYFNLNLIDNDCVLSPEDCESFLNNTNYYDVSDNDNDTNTEFDDQESYAAYKIGLIQTDLATNGYPALTPAEIEAYTGAYIELYIAKRETCADLNALDENPDAPGEYTFTIDCYITNLRLLQDFAPGEQYAVFQDEDENIGLDPFSIYVEDVNNSFLTNASGLTTPIWKNPKSLYDNGIDFYLTDAGEEIDFIEVTPLYDDNGDFALDDAGEFTFNIPIDDLSFNQNITYNGITYNIKYLDGNGNPNVNENGVLKVLPNHVTNAKDFKDNWNPSWAQSLLYYHPEIGYSTFFSEICSQLKSTGLNYPGAENLSSSAYDDFLNQLNYTVQAGQDAIQIQGNIALENLLTNTDWLVEHDPFFKNLYQNITGTNLLGANASYSIFNANPNIDNSHTAQTISVPNPNGGTMPITIANEQEARYEIMKYALEYNADGQGIPIWQIAYRMVMCGDALLFDCTVDSYPNTLNDVIAALSPEDLEEFVNNYIAIYLSTKSKLQFVFSNIYAQQLNFYNGCIEDLNNNPLTVLSSYPQGFVNILSNYYNFNQPNPVVPAGVCYTGAANQFEGKKRRFLPFDVVSEDDNTDEDASDIVEDTDLLYWEATGNCPNALDLNLFINGLFTDQLGNLPDASNPYTNAQYLFADLYTALGGEIIENNATEPIMGANGIQIYTDSSTNTELIINVGDQNDLDSNTNNGATCPITIYADPSSTLNWSNYGANLWYITNVQNLVFTGDDAATGDQKFSFLATVNNNGETIEVVFNGQSCANIGYCGTDTTQAGSSDYDYIDPNVDINLPDGGDCLNKGKVETGIKNVFNELHENNLLFSSTPTTLSTYNSYTSSYLPEFFQEINAPILYKYDNQSFTFYYDQGGFDTNIIKIPTGLLPALSLNYIHSVSINPVMDSLLGNEATVGYAYNNGTITYNQSSFTVSAPINVTETKSIDFNCCTDSADSTTGFIALLNHLISIEPNVPNGYQPQELLDLFPFIALEANNIGIYDFEITQYVTGFNTSAPVLKFSFNDDGEFDVMLLSYPEFTQEPISISGLNFDSSAQDSYPIWNLDLPGYNFAGVESDYIRLSKIFYKNIDFNGCEDCIPVPIPSVSGTQAWQTYITTVGLDQDSNGISDTIPGYALPEWLTEAYFTDLGFKYSIEAYNQYITDLQIIANGGIDSDYFISLEQFGTNALGLGHPQTSDAVTQYANYISIVTQNNVEPLGWLAYVSQIYMKETGVCPGAQIQIDSPTIDDIDPCNAFLENIQLSYANDLHQQYLENVRQDFINEYLNKAMTTLVENLDLNYDDKEYQYTLYYYDQAGNLMQTVSPEGIDRLNTTADASINPAINLARDENIVSVAPVHRLETRYKYNSLNQLVFQNTPDGGETRFAYDVLGRIVASQNAKQLVNKSFSYTKYDALGRIIEAGEMAEAAGYFITDEGILMKTATMAAEVNANNYPENISTARSEVTKTLYDDMLTGKEALFENYTYNHRNRVTAVLYFNKYSDQVDLLKYDNALFYNYDVHGNVKELVTDIANEDLIDLNQRVKKVQYEYDLISGNVNQVTYQKNNNDQFIHRYNYDADNRITTVTTSTDGVIWEQEAAYDYYKHGPLARSVIGDKKVQGLDYVYSLQGWLKGVNGDVLDPTKDVGKDAFSNTVARDAFAYTLSYFDNDYNALAQDPFNASTNHYTGISGSQLFNGNIRGMTTALLGKDEVALTIAYNNYKYDQLNRIKAMQSMEGPASGSGISKSIDPIQSSYTYDKNGNLESLNRSARGERGGVLDMDKFTYDYQLDANNNKVSNKLFAVQDDRSLDPNFATDIDSGQSFGNYKYDQIGQLTSDEQEGIENIEWRVDGKVKQITKSNGLTIAFEYDGLGNRIAKQTTSTSNTDLNKTTYYIRDAQGNVLSVYTLNDARDGDSTASVFEVDIVLESDIIDTIEGTTAAQNSITVAGGINSYVVETNGQQELVASNVIVLKPGFTAKAGNNGSTLSNFVAKIEAVDAPSDLTYKLSEQHIYGSSRLGLQQPEKNLIANVAGRQAGEANTVSYERNVGDKRYELSNHLGNVLEVITDRKLLSRSSLFTPDVVAYNDYYPFGMLLPNRNGSSDSYRYGFQGQEKDDEVKGEGNSINFKFRMHDPRVGRFFATDPLSPQYPWYTPYQFAGNKVIAWRELEGLEEDNVNDEIEEKDSNWFTRGMAILFVKASHAGNEFEKTELGATLNYIRNDGEYVNPDDLSGEEKLINGLTGFGNMVEATTLPLAPLAATRNGAGFLKSKYKKEKPSLRPVNNKVVDNLATSKVKVKVKLPKIEVPEKPLTPPVKLVPSTKREVVEAFLKNDLGKTGIEALGVLNTINFKKGVKKVILNTGDRIWRFVTPGRENAPDQHFFTDAYGADSGPAGVGLTSGNKILIEYKVTSPTTVLQTKIKGTNQTQFISKNLIENAEEVARE